MNAWFYASATTLARRIRDREVSSEKSSRRTFSGSGTSTSA